MHIKEKTNIDQDNFDLANFFSQRSIKDPIGAFLIITNEQCVMGYNDNEGHGYHDTAFDSAIKNIMDMNINTRKDKSFIKGRLVNLGNVAYICFDLYSMESITPNQLRLFEEFRNKYNNMMRFYSVYYNFHTVHLVKKDGSSSSSSDLDEVYDSLIEMVDNEKELPRDKNIIGQIVVDTKRK